MVQENDNIETNDTTATAIESESEEIEQRIPLPNRNKGEIFAIVEQHVGGGRLKVMCEDEKIRLARIPGKIKKRRWIRTGGLIIIRPWDFQDEKSDVVFRYTPTQVANLQRKKLLPDSLNAFV